MQYILNVYGVIYVSYISVKVEINKMQKEWQNLRMLILQTL